jgi:hypothetical protein
MKISLYQYDLTAEVRAWHAARRRRRLAACAGLALFTLLVGRALGGLIADGAHWFGVVAIAAWGCWGAHHLLTRH